MDRGVQKALGSGDALSAELGREQRIKRGRETSDMSVCVGERERRQRWREGGREKTANLERK